MKKSHRTIFKDDLGRWLTQGLFLEFFYQTENAIFTLDDDDKEYEGKEYISLKKKYLGAEDPGEYIFVKDNLGGWQHWQKMLKNKLILKHVEEWREELELLMRSRAIQKMQDLSEEENNAMATKWLADKGWTKREPGRPSKKEQLQKDRIGDRLEEEYAGDVIRLKDM